jgi:hypothetical protein
MRAGGIRHKDGVKYFAIALVITCPDRGKLKVILLDSSVSCATFVHGPGSDTPSMLAMRGHSEFRAGFAFNLTCTGASAPVGARHPTRYLSACLGSVKPQVALGGMA